MRFFDFLNFSFRMLSEAGSLLDQKVFDHLVIIEHICPSALTGFARACVTLAEGNLSAQFREAFLRLEKGSNEHAPVIYGCFEAIFSFSEG